MAVSFVGDVGRGDALYKAYPEEIIVVPHLNGRHEHTSITSLVADIEKNGQNIPVICRQDEQGRPVLVCGHRRYRAIAEINAKYPEKRRRVVFRYEKLTEEQAFQRAIAENHFRKDVSAVDDAANIHTMMSIFAKTKDDVVNVYFPEAETAKEKKDAMHWVNSRIPLINLSDDSAEFVRTNNLKITAAIGLAKLTAEQQKEKVNKAKSEGNKIKVKDVVPAAANVKTVTNKLMKAIQDVIKEADEEGTLHEGDFEFFSVSKKNLDKLREAAGL